MSDCGTLAVHCTVHSISVAIQYTLLLVSNTTIVDIKNSHPECYYVGVVHSLHNATSWHHVFCTQCVQCACVQSQNEEILRWWHWSTSQPKLVVREASSFDIQEALFNTWASKMFSKTNTNKKITLHTINKKETQIGSPLWSETSGFGMMVVSIQQPN
jgi:hypothetical protein